MNWWTGTASGGVIFVRVGGPAWRRVSCARRRPHLPAQPQHLPSHCSPTHCLHPHPAPSPDELQPCAPVCQAPASIGLRSASLRPSASASHALAWRSRLRSTARAAAPLAAATGMVSAVRTGTGPQLPGAAPSALYTSLPPCPPPAHAKQSVGTTHTAQRRTPDPTSPIARPWFARIPCRPPCPPWHGQRWRLSGRPRVPRLQPPPRAPGGQVVGGGKDGFLCGRHHGSCHPVCVVA